MALKISNKVMFSQRCEIVKNVKTNYRFFYVLDIAALRKTEKMETTWDPKSKQNRTSLGLAGKHLLKLILVRFWDHVEPSWDQNWTKLEPSWAKMGPSWTKLALSWAKLEQRWAKLEPSRSQVGQGGRTWRTRRPSWTKLDQKRAKTD